MTKLIKRSKEQREADLNLLADLYVKQVSQMEIAKRLGISQGQVSNDLKKLLKRWEESRTYDIDRYKREQLHKIDMIEQEMWECWERSKHTPKTIITKSKSGEIGHVFNPATARKETQQNEKYWKAGSTEEMPVGGDMQYMNGIQWCVQERIKILGIYAPKKVAATDPTGEVEAGTSAKEELMGMLSGIIKRMQPETPAEKDYVEGEFIERLTEDNDTEISDESIPELAKRLNRERIKRLPAKPVAVEFDQDGNIITEPLTN